MIGETNGLISVDGYMRVNEGQRLCTGFLYAKPIEGWRANAERWHPHKMDHPGSSGRLRVQAGETDRPGP